MKVTSVYETDEGPPPSPIVVVDENRALCRGYSAILGDANLSTAARVNSIDECVRHIQALSDASDGLVIVGPNSNERAAFRFFRWLHRERPNVKTMLLDHLPFIAARALGLTFLASGLSKLRDRDGFVLGVLEYQVLPPPLAILYGRSLPFIEVLLGLALVAGVWPTVAGFASAALLLSFSAAVAINLARKRQLDCHCFTSERGERLGWLTLVRLGILLAFAAIVIRGRGPVLIAPVPAEWVPALLLAFGLFLSMYLLGYLRAVGHIWQIKANQIPRAQSRRVSLRALPLDGSSPKLSELMNEASGGSK
jgi:uncharacterized membrane protein YphA (DoxX/SURF4 family)